MEIIPLVASQIYTIVSSSPTYKLLDIKKELLQTDSRIVPSDAQLHTYMWLIYGEGYSNSENCDLDTLILPNQMKETWPYRYSVLFKGIPVAYITTLHQSTNSIMNPRCAKDYFVKRNNVNQLWIAITCKSSCQRSQTHIVVTAGRINVA